MNEKKHSGWLRNLLYALVLLGFLLLFSDLTGKASARAARTFNPHASILIGVLGNLLFGALLGAEHLLREANRPGRWSFDLPRFVFLGIPGLILGLYPLLYFAAGTPAAAAIADRLPLFLMNSTVFDSLGGILLGYVLASNFSRRA